MRILDTPQWNSLTNAEKCLINNVYSQPELDDPLTTNFTPGAVKMVNSLAERGLITVTWGETHHRATEGTIHFRPEGWQ